MSTYEYFYLYFIDIKSPNNNIRNISHNPMLVVVAECTFYIYNLLPLVYLNHHFH